MKPGQVILLVVAVVLGTAAWSVPPFGLAYTVMMCGAVLCVVALWVVYPPGHRRRW